MQDLQIQLQKFAWQKRRTLSYALACVWQCSTRTTEELAGFSSPKRTDTDNENTDLDYNTFSHAEVLFMTPQMPI